MLNRFIGFGSAAAFLAAVALVPAPASAAPSGLSGYNPDATLIENVGYYKKRRWWRSNSYDTQVRAPTTSVDTSDAYTDVEAPFTSVRKSPRGTWVRAPFVNLFVPRD